NASNERALALAAVAQSAKARQAALDASKQAVLAAGKARSAAREAGRRAAAEALVAKRAQADAQSAIVQSQAMRGEALAATAQAQTSRKNADRYTAESYLGAGSDAFFNGQIDDAAVALSAAYLHDPQNESVRTLLPQALDALALRAGSIPVSHGAVTALEVSPDGRFTVTGDSDGNARIVDAQHRAAALPPHSAPVTAFAFASHSQVLVTAYADGVLRFTDLRTRTAKTIRAHDGRINALAAGNAGVVSAAGDVVKLWSPAGRAVRTLYGSTDTPADAADAAFFTYRGREAVLVAAGTSFEAVDPSNGKVLTDAAGDRQSPTTVAHLAAGPQGAVAIYVDGRMLPLAADGTGELNVVSPTTGLHFSDAAYSPDGGQLALAADDGTVRILKAGTLQNVQTLIPGGSNRARAALSVRFSPDGRYLAAGFDNGRVALWKTAGFARIASVHRHNGQVDLVRFDPASDGFVSGGSDGALAFWTIPADLRLAGRVHRGAVTQIARASTGLLAAASHDGIVSLWNTQNGLQYARSLRHRTHGWWTLDVQFSPDGREVADADGDSASLWRTDGTYITGVDANSGRRLSAAAVLPGGNGFFVAQRNRYGITGAFTGTNKWYEFDAKSKVLQRQPGYQRDIASLQVDPSSRFVLAVSPADKSATLSWLDRSRHEQILHDVAAASLVPGRDFYLVGAPDGSMHSMSARTGAMLAQEAAASSTQRVNVIAVSPDGTMAAWALSGSDTVQLRSLQQNGAIVIRMAWAAGELHGGGSEVRQIAFSPHLRLILATFADGTVRVWDRAGGNVVEDVLAPGPITAAQFVDEEGTLALGMSDGRMYEFHPHSTLGAPGAVASRVVHSIDAGDLSVTTTMYKAYRELQGAQP
ncbi:MAG TPA: WD40 repeat domain-containing protein, partial [Candidatus Baltobacteraceae bacterium]|nr:WD40 repeat domain-containing protein [Candidatus Baltobacteraceae bacterium]